ncbi:MAG: 30S ribosome-binding factor RbfA [Candidatus Aminicenantaceae bacterium]
MQESRRQKRVSNLIKEELSRLVIESFQDSTSGLITITHVSMSKDLKNAHVYLSVIGHSPKQEILDLLNERQGYLRKAVASKTKLKYNPLLIFSLDDSFEYEERIQNVIKTLDKNEK